MRFIAFLTILLLGACATSPAPINSPRFTPEAAVHHISQPGEDVLVLAFSGGGARAAAFQLGVLQELRATHGADNRPLTEHVGFATAVSGGAILSAYYALHGDDGLDSFRATYLDKDWRLNNLFAPTTWWRAVRGGANGPDQLADWLDREIYDGALMRDATRGPRVIINATDLYNATPFAFTETFFTGICSDLSSIRVADAVAASMAVPLIFRPVLVETYTEQCAAPAWPDAILQDRSTPEAVRATARAFENYGDSAAQTYLHLADGGVFDNFGLSSIAVMRAAGPPPSPLTESEAREARRMLVLVVNAERRRERPWPHEASGPNGVDALATTIDVATDAAKRSALDAFRASLGDWRDEIVRYRCAAPEAAEDCAALEIALEVISLRDAEGGPDDLIQTPTLVSLPRETIDALIAGGRAAVRGNEAVQAFARPSP